MPSPFRDMNFSSFPFSWSFPFFECLISTLQLLENSNWSINIIILSCLNAKYENTKHFYCLFFVIVLLSFFQWIIYVHSNFRNFKILFLNDWNSDSKNSLSYSVIQREIFPIEHIKIVSSHYPISDYRNIWKSVCISRISLSVY